MFSFLVDEWRGEDDYPPNENKVFDAIISAFNYNRREAAAAVVKTRSSLMERQLTVSAIFSKLQRALAGSEIVYLPTYRRIELALRGDLREAPYRRRRPKFDIASGSLFTGEIQFGLTDISDRLSQLNQQIILEFNIGYREISANIINELLDGSFDNEPISDLDVPSSGELKLFFERLERGRRQGPYMPVSVPNLEKLYTGKGVPARLIPLT